MNLLHRMVRRTKASAPARFSLRAVRHAIRPDLDRVEATLRQESDRIAEVEARMTRRLTALEDRLNTLESAPPQHRER